MAKYQKPCCILTKTKVEEEVSPGKDFSPYFMESIIYQGSARGCDIVGITEFKDICEETGLPTFTAGHQGAFGLGLKEKDIDNFIYKTDKILEMLSFNN